VPAAPRSVDGVIAANKGQYDQCQRAEIAQNPSAPRRYSVAVTVDRQGRAEWVELLSEASAEMKSCVQSVTRGLDFPKPATGSSRSIATLSFTGAP
jgi:flagellar biosynthesis/type III secretory pathway M-ring protein FliF/YscJ